MKAEWDNWLERLYNLRRGKSGSHERPHKPVLLLSIIDLLDHGLIDRNEVPLSEELVRAFRSYFDIVRQGDDQPSIQNPSTFFRAMAFGTWCRRQGSLNCTCRAACPGRRALRTFGVGSPTADSTMDSGPC